SPRPRGPAAGRRPAVGGPARGVGRRPAAAPGHPDGGGALGICAADDRRDRRRRAAGLRFRRVCRAVLPGQVPGPRRARPRHAGPRAAGGGVGGRLRPLRDEGVLIVGSGFLTHGLPFLQDFRFDAAPPGWSAEFDHWAAEALDAGDVDTLADFRDAPAARYAHPTTEHFAPLFVTLGAAGGSPAPATTITGHWLGLAKRSIQVA